MQRSLWTSQRLNPDQPVQNMALVSRIDGPIDPGRLAQAFAQVVNRQDVLRTTIQRGAEGDRVELLAPTVTAETGTEIISCSPDELLELASARCRQPLDMARRGFDSAVAVHADGTCSWYLNLHHVITDATSSAMVFAATASAYWQPDGPSSDRADQAHDDGAESYYRWVQSLDSEGVADRSVARARRHWSDRSPAPRLDRLYRMVEQPIPGESTGSAERLALDLGDDLLKAAQVRLDDDFKMLSADLSWTVLLTTAMALYLHRLSGFDRFAIGLPVHHRGRPDTKSLIGPTMEVFPVDIVVEPDDTYRNLHRRVGRSVIETLRNAAPGTSPLPDYNAVVNVIPRAEQDRFGSFQATTRWIHPGAIDRTHLIRLQMTRYTDDANFDFALDLNHRAAEPRHREWAEAHLTAILEALVNHPDDPVGSTSLCTGDERRIIDDWGHGPPLDDAAGGASSPVVVRLLDRLAGSDETALTEAERSWTGGELHHWIATTATWLARRGVQPGDRVAIDLARSVEAVVAVIAVQASGCSFVPLDPSQPDDRRRSLIERAGCDLVISSSNPIPDWDAKTMKATVDSVGPEWAARIGLDDEAYLLFTSGSTGEPKGVPISHRGLSDYIAFASEAYVDGIEPVVAPLFSALTFDLTITTLFVPLLVGGRLIVIGDEGTAGLVAVAAHRDITWCKATPSHLEILSRLLPQDHRLRTIIVGGEAFGTALAKRLLTINPRARIFNEYGPTEAVVGCMIYEAEAEILGLQDEVPIGRPAPGVQLVVVDRYLQPTPIGSAGELLISHRGVTTGYLGSPADSPAADADPSPFVELEGQRFYRSGDLVRLQDDQRLVYLGRIDEQVKVGGRRLEPIEVEQAMAEHPSITRAAVRLWSPSAVEPTRHCLRCGLPDNVPGVEFDQGEICETCHAYDAVAPVATSWFKNPEDLRAELTRARRERTGGHDVLHLLSGGKDSTYALYQLVELGATPYALTLDNGYISDGAKDNVRRSVEDLGIDHEFVTVEAMNEIFADSLTTYSNVCNGCYKTIYTLATNRATELGIPMIVTGLSRGQLFETRLIPQQFDLDRFDPEAIDRAVVEARKIYHRTEDAVNRLLDTEIFVSDDVFDRIRYVDFYRYVDVELSEMLSFLTSRAPWVRPSDTGRSTNCLVNAAGIHTHLTEQGYHNYAIPYAWDVRLGHKTRTEAIEELDDQLDLDDVANMLADIGYQPRRREVLTAWFETEAGVEVAPEPGELRGFLADRLPDFAIPAAFVTVDEIPLTGNGKLDADALPEPARLHRPSAGLHVAATTDSERSVVEIWERVLGIEPIGIDDDFFALGGDSLAALEAIVALSDELAVDAPEDLAFRHTTPRRLAEALDQLGAVDLGPATESLAVDGDRGRAQRDGTEPVPGPTPPDETPELSSGQQAVLFDQAERPDDVMYNVGRVYRIRPDNIALADLDGLRRALQAVAERHQPLSWTYGAHRRRLSGPEAVAFTVGQPIAEQDLEAVLAAVHRRPFDLADGASLRCLVQPVVDADTAVLLVVHHASSDADSFDIIWNEANDLLAGRQPEPLPTDYSRFCQWQHRHNLERHRLYWTEAPVGGGNRLAFHVDSPEPDGFLTKSAAIEPAELAEAAARSGVTPFAVAVTALGAALSPFCHQPDVEVGLITSTRTRPESEGLVGYFLNTVPFATDADPVVVSQRLGSTLAHRSYPLAQILADRRVLGLPASPPSIFVAYDDLGPSQVGSEQAEQRVLSNGSAVADATIFFERRPDRLDLSLEYRGSVMTRSQAEQLLTAIDQALSAQTGVVARVVGNDVAVDDGQPHSGASVLHGPEQRDPRGGRHLVIDQIADLLAVGGEGVAVICGDQRLSWAELNRRSRAVATDLLDQGIQPGQPVIVSEPRSVDLIVAIVGTLRAGAAYVAIDPTYPEQRRRLLIMQSGARLQARPSAADRSGADVSDDRELPTIDGADLAYIIFTSGSTGQPKPVAIAHEQLSTSTNARPLFYGEPVELLDGPGASDSAEPLPGDEVGDFRFLMVSSASFDSSVAGIFWALSEGGTIVLPTEDEVHDVDALADLIPGRRITHTLMVPTLYQAILSSMVRRGLVMPVGARSWWPQEVIVAGEACPPGLVDQHYRLFPLSRLSNEYGPTEATVWATGHHTRFGDPAVPIGGPVAGTWVKVVDQDGSTRPIGVEGELVIGGAGVASQFGDVYATGDRAVIHGDLVHFLGRLDNQLNVNGIRVEPEDIEGLLMTVDGVRAAVATTTEDGRLVAHVHAGDTDDLERRLRDAAREALPPSWRPSAYGVHDRLPLTPNGKVDRDAARDLPLPEPGPATVADGTPPDDREFELAKLFASSLGAATFGVDDSFFDHGGHSLTAIDLLLAIEERFGRRLAVPTLYRAQTPRALARHLDPTEDRPATGVASSPGSAFLVPIQTQGTRPPIFGIHVLGIDCAFFRPLAARLGFDQPVYGLGQPTNDTELQTEGPTAVAEVAATYAAEVNRVAPDGPIVLAAISLGGVVAFETAQQLVAAGRDVALLALFDAAGPEAVVMQKKLGIRGRLTTHANALREDPREYVVGRSAYQVKKLRRVAELTESRLRRRLGLEPSHRLEVRRFIEENIQSQLNYDYKPYRKPMAVYKAAEDPFTSQFMEIDMGWQPVALGGITIKVVDGDHLTMVAEPHVEQLARFLQADLAEHLGLRRNTTGR